MNYKSLRQCVDDLAQHGHLVRLDVEVDAHLEAAEIHRRVYRSGGPAILFTRVRNCRFPMVSNLFGTIDRARFIFRHTLEPVRRAIELKIDPQRLLGQWRRYWRTPLTALHMRPKFVRSGPVISQQTTIDQLPQLQCWPDDGGAFITLPQVLTENARAPGLGQSNLGMYRIQISGGQYRPNQEIGLHYQIHRGIGVHHQAAMELGRPFRVNVFVGGTPAMTLAAVMPLPENMSELMFAGALAGHRIPMIRQPYQPPIYAQADFCIVGTVDPDRQLPEGPFGDHLGYYSLAHDFPILRVDKVYHRPGAIWPFTVVGRPPQEDTVFGKLIHELTGPVIPSVLPGVKQVNAVDAAGVHPLLLAIGSERYVPYRPADRPQELLTQANAILGQGQMSLAKYLWIIDGACDPDLTTDDIPRFLTSCLQRVDWTRDLHFQTQTTIDTLDYSGSGLNSGSKLVIAAARHTLRELPTELRATMQIPNGFFDPRICLPGVLAVRGSRNSAVSSSDMELDRFCNAIDIENPINRFPLIVLVDDSEFVSADLNNFLWVVFTRSNPATDVGGVGWRIENKHWGCRGSLVIDARIRPHHAPPLIEDPGVSRKVDVLAAAGGPLAKYL